MMVVDLSSSMDARDMVEEDRSVNRLDVTKEVFRDFVLGSDRTAGRGRGDDLIGIVTFARYADSLCPLTLDHGNLVNMVKDLEIVSQRQEDGTAVGDGLGLAVERLRPQQGEVAHRDSVDRWRHQCGSDRSAEGGRTGQPVRHQGLLYRSRHARRGSDAGRRLLRPHDAGAPRPVKIDEDDARRKSRKRPAASTSAPWTRTRSPASIGRSTRWNAPK